MYHLYFTGSGSFTENHFTKKIKHKQAFGQITLCLFYSVKSLKKAKRKFF
jgi:hypothetical protein